MFFLLSGISTYITASAADSAALTSEQIELEKQRLQIQRELIQLEREKLEVERLKLQHSETAVCPPQQPIKAAKKSSYTKDLYVGLDYIFFGRVIRTVTQDNTDSETRGTQNGYGIKLGFGTMDENRVEITYSKQHVVFDETYPDWDTTMLSLDYLFLFSEAFGKHLSPAVKIGLATARGENITNTVRALGYNVKGQDEISGSALRVGMGLFYTVDDTMELAVGLDTSGITWAELSLTGGGSTDILEFKDTASVTYMTLNYHF